MMDSEIQKMEPVKPVVKAVSSVTSASSASAATVTSNNATPPRLTRTLLVVLCMTTIAVKLPGVGKGIVSNFTLMPMATVGQSKLWNVVTAGFVDTNMFAAAVNLALFFTMGRWIESSWGARPMLFYLILINTLSAIVTYVSMLAAYVATRVDTYFFTAVGTTNGICIALLVAIKQLIPDHEIGSASVNVAANYLPLIYMSLVVLLTSISFFRVGVLVFTAAAFHFSWLYLRYYRFNTAEGVYGDLSELFGYATLFPQPVRPMVSMVADILFIILRPLLMAAQGAQTGTQQQQNGSVANGGDVYMSPLEQQQDLKPSSKASSMDTERRRQRALKLLDERIQSAATASGSDSKAELESTPGGGDSAV